MPDNCIFCKIVITSYSIHYTKLYEVQAAGTIRVGEGGWRGLTVKNFLVDYALRDNQLTISRMSGNFAGGSFNNTAYLDLRRAGLGYDTVINLKGRNNFV